MKSHCIHGHEYTEANSYMPPNGRRRCRECLRIDARARYWRTPKAHRDRSTAYRLKHPEVVALLKKQWDTDNREHVLAYKRKSRAEQPEVHRNYNRTRRARKLNQLGNFSPWMIRYYRFRQQNLCWYCGVEMLRNVPNSEPKQETLDHMISLNDGGLHTQSNTVLACRKCNGAKHTKSHEQFKAR